MPPVRQPPVTTDTEVEKTCLSEELEESLEKALAGSCEWLVDDRLAESRNTPRRFIPRQPATTDNKTMAALLADSTVRCRSDNMDHRTIIWYANSDTRTIVPVCWYIRNSVHKTTGTPFSGFRLSQARLYIRLVYSYGNCIATMVRVLD